MNETVVETKTCNHCQSNFEITQGDLDFYDKISPTFAGQRFHIPTPALCPDCRQRRRLSFRNERKLYRRICDATQQPIISIYSPDKPYKVYDQKMRRSDSRDAMDYGFEFDFTKTFTQNFKKLLKLTPQPALSNLNAENSEYCNRCNYNKDCYLVFMTSHSEDSLYGTFIQKSIGCVDCSTVVSCSSCYEGIDLTNCANLKYSNNCQDCSYSLYLQYCRGCSFCYGCNNLKNKQYCVFNKQYTKEQYEELIKGISLESVLDFQKIAIKESSLFNCENCSGSHLTNCKNCKDCCSGFLSEDCKFILNFGDLKDSYDCTAFGHKCALNIENIAGEEDYHVGFTFATLNARDVWCSMFCSQGIADCFGCIGLRNKQYCIFNRQYENKEKYEEQASKIIQHMMTTGERGEFFHPSLSPFGYNETVAQEYYPAVAEGEKLKAKSDGDKAFSLELSALGYHRSSYEAPTPQSDKVINGQDLPDTIAEVDDSILQYAIKCEVTGKLFRIQPQELAFYRKHHIPLPRKHPDQRHLDRLALRK